MSDACSVLNPGHTLNGAVNWCRSDFWHPQDLQDLNIKLRDLPLTEPASSLNFSSLPFVEHRWTSFDPDLGKATLNRGTGSNLRPVTATSKLRME